MPSFGSSTRPSRFILNLASVLPLAFGLSVLAWVGWLIWYDLTFWSKDITRIFMESRTGQAIDLGIGMTIFHYFMIGLAPTVFSITTLVGRFILWTKARKRTKEVKYVTKGTVANWLGKRGYGFIECKDGKKIFVHKSDIQGKSSLSEGEEVEFEVTDTDRGPRAFKVKPISE
jgi:CspA family cold shock protein